MPYFLRFVPIVLVACAIIIAPLTGNAGESVIGPAPWIPSSLDDWPKLVAEAKDYCVRHNGEQQMYRSSLAQQAWGTDWYISAMRMGGTAAGCDIPMPPAGMLQDDILVVQYALVLAKMHFGCGQTLVWRGLDGKAIGTTVFVQRAQIQANQAAAMPDPDAALKSFRERLDAARPPVAAWSVKTDPGCWSASWQRPGGVAATRDDRQGRAPPLRPEDIQWLSVPPPPLPQQAGPEPLPEDAYPAAVAAHPRVQEKLQRFASGFGPDAVVISKIVPGSQAEHLGWRIGDGIAAVNGTAIHSQRQLEQLMTTLSQGPRTVRLLREGQPPSEVPIEPGKVGFISSSRRWDMGLAVLAATSPANDETRRDVAVVLFAQDSGPLVRRAWIRLTSVHLPRPLQVFLQAWTEAAAGDLGQVLTMLRGPILTEDPALIRPMETLLESTRSRSGRLLMLWPTITTDPSSESLLRHVVARIPPAERFGLLASGQPPGVWTEDLSSAIEPAYQEPLSTETLHQGSITLVCSDKNPWSTISFRGLPEHCEITMGIAFKPHPVVSSNPNLAYPLLDIGLVANSEHHLSDAGFGKVFLWQDGTVDVVAPTIDSKGYEERWLATPLQLVTDGINANILRVVCGPQMQRIELNGHEVMQGLRPLIEPSDDPMKLTLRIISKGLPATITGLHIRGPRGTPVPSNF